MLLPSLKKKNPKQNPFFQKGLCEQCQAHEKRNQTSQILIFATLNDILVQDMK